MSPLEVLNREIHIPASNGKILKQRLIILVPLKQHLVRDLHLGWKV